MSTGSNSQCCLAGLQVCSLQPEPGGLPGICFAKELSSKVAFIYEQLVLSSQIFESAAENRPAGSPPRRRCAAEK